MRMDVPSCPPEWDEPEEETKDEESTEEQE